MKNQHATCILIGVLLSVFLLFSCKEDPADGTEPIDGTATQTQPYTIVHTVTDLTDTLPRYLADEHIPGLEQGAPSALNSYVHNGKLYIYAMENDQREPDPRLIPYSADGIREEENIVCVPLVSDIVPTFARQLENGRFCLLYDRPRAEGEDSPTETCPMAAITEADGSIVCEVMIRPQDATSPTSGRSQFYQFQIHEEAGGDVAMMIVFNGIGNSYHYRAAEETIEKANVTVENLNQFGRAVFLGDGVYQMAGTVAGLDAAQTLHALTGELTPMGNLGLSAAEAGLMVTRGINGALYLYNNLAIYRYHEDTKTLTKIVDMMDCGMLLQPNGVYADRLYIFDDNTVLLSSAKVVDASTERHFYHIRTKVKNEPDPRTVLRLDYYGFTSNALTYRVLEAVSAFHVKFPDYKFDMRILDVKEAFMTQSTQEFMDTQLLYGDHPDIIISEHMDIERYYDKETFLDLRSVGEGKLLGCVMDAMQYGEMLYAVPLYMQLNTFVCLPETCDGLLTWDAFYPIIDGLGEGELLTTDSSAVSYIYNNGIMDFFDRGTAEASYDSEDFIDMISYVTALDKVIDKNAGYLMPYDDNGICYTNATLPARIADGGVKLININVSTPAAVQAAVLLFGENEVSWCGYPSRDGGGAYLYMPAKAAVMADTDNPEAALLFMEHLLSDDMQTGSGGVSIAVTDSGVRAQLAQVRYQYYDTADYEKIGDPNAISAKPTTFIEDENGNWIPVYDNAFSLSPKLTSPTPSDPTAHLGNLAIYNEQRGALEYIEYTEVVMEDAEVEKFMAFLNTCNMKSGTDQTITQIVEEELSYWENGVTPIEEAAKKIQSRVQIYLAESK